MGRPTKLTPEVQRKIVEYVSAGAYDWVAAQAVGIRPATFYNWMKWGRRKPTPRKPNPYFDFFEEVSQARADARLKAEIKVRIDEPKFWLRCGPGKERPGEPGWTETRQISGPEGGPIPLDVDLKLLSDDDLAKLEEILGRGKPSRG
jgi:transposase